MVSTCAVVKVRRNPSADAARKFIITQKASSSALAIMIMKSLPPKLARNLAVPLLSCC